MISDCIRDKEKCFKAGSKIAIDESHFITDKNGKMHWIFGMVDLEDEAHSLFILVDDRSEKTLLPLIKRWVLATNSEKSTIISDGWGAYTNLEKYRYIHRIEFHNVGFLNPFPDSTNPIERAWSSIKRNLNQYSGNCNPKHLQAFIESSFQPSISLITRFDS